MHFHFRQEEDSKVLLKLVPVKDDHSIEINGELGNKALIKLNEGYEVSLKDDIIVTGKIENYYGIPRSQPRKVQVLQNARERLEQRTEVLNMVDFITFIDVNNILHSKGFFITEDNREEKYLEILETGNDELIDLLEEFLIAKDNLNPLVDAKKQYTKTIERLKEIDEDSEEVTQLLAGEID